MNPTNLPRPRWTSASPRVPLATLATLVPLVLLAAATFREARAASDPRPEPRLGPGDSVGLFDGETLEGFTERGGRYDGNARWTVEDGTIVGRQGPNKAGGLLYTEATYRNFVFTVETRIDYPFDSGVFVRMSPDGKGAQVTLDYRPDGEVGAIYSDEFLLHNREAKARWLEDDWNRFTVRCVGDDYHLTVWMNGEVITDWRMEDPAAHEGFVPDGLVGLQVHGGEDVPDETAARFRAIRIRELPELDEALFTCDERGLLHPKPQAREQGWRPLFDGETLDGLDPRPSPEHYRAQGGLLELLNVPGGGEIRTAADYRDFELRLDFRISRMANSGLFLRADRDGGDPAYSGCEVQILDDFHWEDVTGTTLKPWQFTGSLYGAVPPGDRAAHRPLGRWNTYSVRYEGSRLRVALNGRLLYDVDTFDLDAKPPFRERAAAGFIGLQRHAPAEARGESYAAFRNLWIRPLGDG